MVSVIGRKAEVRAEAPVRATTCVNDHVTILFFCGFHRDALVSVHEHTVTVQCSREAPPYDGKSTPSYDVG